jgi:hypothetical protein
MVRLTLSISSTPTVSLYHRLGFTSGGGEHPRPSCATEPDALTGNRRTALSEYDLLNMPITDFTDKATQVDKYFRDSEAGFFFDRATGQQVMDIFAIPVDDEGISTLGDLVDFTDLLDDLSVFAFGEAPDSIIKEWGKAYGDGDETAGSRVSELVGIVRDVMPSAGKEWRRKRGSIHGIVDDIRAFPVYSLDSGDLTVLLKLSKFDASPMRLVPVAGTRQNIEVPLTRSDLRRLMAKLQIADRAFEAEEAVDEQLSEEA